MNTARPVCLITGGGTGVGRAAAIAFARRGFDVVVNYSRSQAEAEETSELVRATGGDALVYQCDVSEESAVLSMVDGIGSRFGRLDILVNNAAQTYFIPADDLGSLTEEKWDRLLAINLKGPFFCIKASVGLLNQSPLAAIVNVSSVAGVTGRGSSIAYAASKGALNTMTKSFARSLAPKIRVNAILPGPINSRWIREGNNDWDLNEMTADYPIPRPSEPEDIAAAILYLSLDTRMTTGQLLTVDGGQTL